MAKSVERSSWKNGYREAGVAGCTAWAAEVAAHYKPPPSSEILTSDAHNDLGLNVLRTWPTIYNGTNTPHDLPKWWRPRSEVDVLICGGKMLPYLLCMPFSTLIHYSGAGRSAGGTQSGETRSELPYRGSVNQITQSTCLPLTNV